RVYVKGSLHSVRVPLREIHLKPSKLPNGAIASNEPVRVYDCSGPWGDPAFTGTVQEGLPALRKDWILSRGDVEEVSAPAFPNGMRRLAEIPHSLERKPLRARSGKAATQLYYARQGMITPEMEFIAIRENLGRERARKAARPGRDLGSNSFGASIPEFIT